MQVEVAFTGILREKAGCDRKAMVIEPDKSLLEILKELEKELNRPLNLLKNEELQEGLVLFYRNETGGLSRITNLYQSIKSGYRELVLTTSMAGG